MNAVASSNDSIKCLDLIDARIYLLNLVHLSRNEEKKRKDAMFYSGKSPTSHLSSANFQFEVQEQI